MYSTDSDESSQGTLLRHVSYFQKGRKQYQADTTTPHWHIRVTTLFPAVTLTLSRFHPNKGRGHDAPSQLCRCLRSTAEPFHRRLPHPCIYPYSPQVWHDDTSRLDHFQKDQHIAQGHHHDRSASHSKTQQTIKTCRDHQTRLRQADQTSLLLQRNCLNAG